MTVWLLAGLQLCLTLFFADYALKGRATVLCVQPVPFWSCPAGLGDMKGCLGAATLTVVMQWGYC